jgi:hypothetical protein
MILELLGLLELNLGCNSTRLVASRDWWWKYCPLRCCAHSRANYSLGPPEG